MATQHAHTAVFALRYKFNGKELDPATGYYYYGARYYNPTVSQWLSIDPLAEKYPAFSPYNYTLNNPVILVDPDGRAILPLDNYFYDSATGNTIVVKTDDEKDNLFIDGHLFQTLTKGQLSQGYTNQLFGMNKPMNIVSTIDKKDKDFENKVDAYLLYLKSEISNIQKQRSAINEVLNAARKEWENAYKQLQAAKESWISAKTEEFEGMGRVHGYGISYSLFILQPAYRKEEITYDAYREISHVADSLSAREQSLLEQYYSFVYNLDFNTRVKLGLHEKFLH